MVGTLKVRPPPRERLRAMGLVLPLLIFLGVTFLAPLGTMLLRSVHDPVVADALPATLAELRDWEGKGCLPRRHTRRRRGNSGRRGRRERWGRSRAA